MLTNSKRSALSAISTLAMTLAVPAMTLAVPAIAQDAMSKDSMSSGSMMKMSAGDTKKMTKCNAMSHDMMMKSPACMKWMKMHPDMMKGDSMMSGH